MVERLDQLRREQLSDTRWWAAHSDRVLAMLGSMFASGQLNPWEMDAKNRSDCVHDAAEIVWDVLHRGGRNL